MRLPALPSRLPAAALAACALAALLAGRVALRGGTVGVVISGGNVDVARFASLTAT